MTETKIINVGINEYKVGFGSHLLQTLGIGSCLAVALYDPIKKIGGLSHSLLPWSENKKPNPKYVDSAIELLLKEMKLKGADFQNLEARMIGGANMFSQAEPNSFDIGRKNIQAASRKLKERGIKIVARAVGKNLARNVEFNLATGKLIIKAI